MIILLFNKMKKYFLLIVLLYSVLSQDADSGNCLTSQTFSDKECFQEQKDDSQYYCCVVTATTVGSSKRECLRIHQRFYDEELEDYKNYKKDKYKASEVSVDCRPGYNSESRSSSNYLQLSILCILILIINL